MDAAEVLSSLRRRGVKLEAAGAKIRASPPDILTEDDRSHIRRAKQGLLDLLAAEEARAGSINVGELQPQESYSLITDLDGAIAAIAAHVDASQRGAIVGLDLETTGLDPLVDDPRLLQLSRLGTPTTVIDLQKVGGLAALRSPLGHLKAVAHNAVFDMSFLWHGGVHLRGLDCTMIAEHVLSGARFSGLADLARRYLGVGVDKRMQQSCWSGELSPEQIRYAAVDAEIVRAVFEGQSRRLHQDSGHVVYDLVRDAQPAVVQMMLAGAPFDGSAHEMLCDKLDAETHALEEEARRTLGGLNPRSARDLSVWLQQQLPASAVSRWERSDDGLLRSSKDVLMAGLHHLPESARSVVTDVLLPLRAASSRSSVWGRRLLDHVHPLTGRVHASLQLTGAATGRMACSKPNLQNVPRDRSVRAVFAPADGAVLVIADLAQIELRVVAELSGDRALREAFASGADVHRSVAAMLVGKEPDDVTKDERQLAKAVNFGLLYGQSAEGLRRYVEREYGRSLSSAAAIGLRDRWLVGFPQVAQWQRQQREECARTGLVRTPSGRRRRPEDGSSQEALNTPVQGGAAEVMLAALRHLDRALRDVATARPVMVVHDEVVVETSAQTADEVAQLVERSLIRGMQDIFPDAPTLGLVAVAVARNWAGKG